MTTENVEKISGKYTHYKGKYYDVFCSAFDREGNKYVLYQQCYGDKSFWIRPYDMFFDSVDVNGTTVKRFTANSTKLQTSDKKIKKIITLIENQNILIRHTETEKTVIITHINESDNLVMVHQLDDMHMSGYLTEYEISRRLGYISCRINGEIKYFKSNNKVAEHCALHIGNNDIENLKHYINPCSIDLQIADSGFLRTRLKLVDPQSIEHVSSASLGFGRRATQEQKAKVILELRREFEMDVLLKIAELPRSTFHYHSKRSNKEDKYAHANAEIAAIYHENREGMGIGASWTNCITAKST